MLYSELVGIYVRLEATTKRLEKRDILSELYKECSTQEISQVVLLSMGIVAKVELGIANEVIKKTISKSYSISEKDVVKKFNEIGDLGLTAEFFSQRKKQTTLERKKLTVNEVFETINKLPEITGKGSVDKKMQLMSKLLIHASPLEVKYITRTILGEMRVGVAAGIVRDALAVVFKKSPEEIEQIYNVTGNYGEVSEQLKKGIAKAKIVIGKPVRVMLGERASNLKEALEKFKHSAIEVKYDGLRLCVHKKDNEIKLFSRRLENVTKQFPEIISLSKECIKAKSCIIEGEALAVDKEGKPKPFQFLSKRIQRKYDIEKTSKDIPIEINLFDIIYLNGKELMSESLKKRWKILKKIIKEKKEFRLAEHIETNDFEKAQKFYEYSLKLGQEGVMVKNLDAGYQPGRRVGYWLKVKPVMEPLDLVIVGARWGEGLRAKYLGSLILACRDKEKLLETGMLGSGLTEKQLDEITKKLKNLIIGEKTHEVKVKPEIVIEVAYEEIQKSPKYASGYALRFPRLLRFREKEKSASDINTKSDIEKLFFQQKRIKHQKNL